MWYIHRLIISNNVLEKNTRLDQTQKPQSIVNTVTFTKNLTILLTNEFLVQKKYWYLQNWKDS